MTRVAGQRRQMLLSKTAVTTERTYNLYEKRLKSSIYFTAFRHKSPSELFFNTNGLATCRA